ncbi:MAG: nucleotidyltransferase family protein, partial [Planctomycetia bacterium]
VMLKGPALGERLFGGAANRGYWDLDILVHEHDREYAGRLLEEKGFRRTSSVLCGERMSALFVHGFDYERHDLKVDLHWCLSRAPGLRVDSSAMMRRATMFNVGGRKTPVLAVEDELVFELVSMFADLQRGGLRLQAFVDLWAMLRELPGIVWEEFFARRKVEGCEAACRG